MDGSVVDVGAVTVRGGETVAQGLHLQAEVLLFVTDEMLGRRNDAGVLDALHGLCHGDSGQDRVGAEA